MRNKGGKRNEILCNLFNRLEIVSIYYPRDGVVMEECIFHGTWHNPQKPLQMKITNVRGGVLDIGYGTDH